MTEEEPTAEASNVEPDSAVEGMENITVKSSQLSSHAYFI